MRARRRSPAQPVLPALVLGAALATALDCSSRGGAPAASADGGAADVTVPAADASPVCRATGPDASGAVRPEITAKGDSLRTAWYPDQPGLHPAIVGGPAFGRLFDSALRMGASEAVLAQPLVFEGTLFVVTEANTVYALDAETGAITASVSLGPSFQASDVGCSDLPLVGITGTPVIDPTSGTAYFFSKTYKTESSTPVWRAHAVDVHTLAERPSFPIEIAGAAANDPSITFDPKYEMQRPGLLLSGGVVYAAFGSHCDVGPFRGYVVGVGVEG
jgi:hypothetical protein